MKAYNPSGKTVGFSTSGVGVAAGCPSAPSASGSSNGVSNFNPGIMTTLSQQAKAKGLSYFDWNVASADAGATTEADVVLQNCKTGVQNIKDPVILCHDVKDYTVKAMETFIPWAIENGYTFLPLTPDSPNAHHKVNN